METAFSARLRDRCDRIWAGLHAHPFLGELARGTLPLDRFRFFIEQDLLFLPAFARAMAMGAAKSASDADLEFFTRQLDGIIRLEIPSNRRLLDQVIGLGAEDRGGARGMAPANVAYTSFLLATAAAVCPLEITAAILPCSWSYIEIAAGLKDEIADHPVYSDWVAFYLQDEEADLVLNMRETFDDMTREGAISDEKREQLAEISTTSSTARGHVLGDGLHPGSVARPRLAASVRRRLGDESLDPVADNPFPDYSVQDERVAAHELLGRLTGGEDAHGPVFWRVREGPDHEQLAAPGELLPPLPVRGHVGRDLGHHAGRHLVQRHGLHAGPPAAAAKRPRIRAQPSRYEPPR